LKVKDSLTFLINFVFPNNCIVCSAKSGFYLCDKCLNSIKIYDKKRCSICSRPILSGDICGVCLSTTRYYSNGYSLFNYKNDTIKKIIEFIKFFNNPKLVNFLFYFRKEILNLAIFDGVECIVPSPMHKDDIRARGYNQSVSISKVLSKITGLPVCYDMILKIKKTKKQVGLNYNGRKRNLSGAFQFCKSYNVKKVLIVDDVFTTGSTINECAKILKSREIESNFFTIAITPSYSD